MIGPEHNTAILNLDSRKNKKFLDMTPEEAIKEIKENLKFSIAFLIIAFFGLEMFNYYIIDLILVIVGFGGIFFLGQASIIQIRMRIFCGFKVGTVYFIFSFLVVPLILINDLKVITYFLSVTLFLTLLMIGFFLLISSKDPTSCLTDSRF